MTSPDEVLLEEMLEAIERTKGYAARGRAVFLSDYDTRELIVHHLEHLSESADQASQRLKKASPLVPWRDLRELRMLRVANRSDCYRAGTQCPARAAESDRGRQVRGSRPGMATRRLAPTFSSPGHGRVRRGT